MPMLHLQILHQSIHTYRIQRQQCLGRTIAHQTQHFVSYAIDAVHAAIHHRGSGNDLSSLRTSVYDPLLRVFKPSLYWFKPSKPPSQHANLFFLTLVFDVQEAYQLFVRTFLHNMFPKVGTPSPQCVASLIIPSTIIHMTHLSIL